MLSSWSGEKRPTSSERTGSRQSLRISRSRAADAFPRRIDAIVHLAQANVARAAAPELDAVNVRGTAAVLEYARRAGAASFVFASSGSVYGGAARPLRESDPARPADAYARSKLTAEGLVEDCAEAFATTILRLFVPYGPGQRGRRLVPELVARVRESRPVTLRDGGRPRLSPIHVDHVVDVLAKGTSATEASLVNVAGEETFRYATWRRRSRDCRDRAAFRRDIRQRQEDLVGDTAALRRRFRLPDPLVTFEQGVAAMLVESTPTLG